VADNVDEEIIAEATLVVKPWNMIIYFLGAVMNSWIWMTTTGCQGGVCQAVDLCHDAEGLDSHKVQIRGGFI